MELVCNKFKKSEKCLLLSRITYSKNIQNKAELVATFVLELISSSTYIYIVIIVVEMDPKDIEQVLKSNPKYPPALAVKG